MMHLVLSSKRFDISSVHGNSTLWAEVDEVEVLSHFGAEDIVDHFLIDELLREIDDSHMFAWLRERYNDNELKRMFGLEG